MDNTPNEPAGKVGEFTRTKTRKVIEHVELDAGKILDIKVTIPKDLGEAFVIAVIDRSGTAEQYTVHRPIGITDLAPDSWVMTRTSELRFLMSRREDSTQREIDRALAQARTDFLVSKSLLIKVGDKIHYPPSVSEGEERNLVFDRAEAELKVAKRFHKDEHDHAQLGKPKAAVYHGYPGKREDFLEEQVKIHEKKIRDAVASEDFLKIAKPIKAKQTFRTIGGPNWDKPQVNSAHLPPGKIERAIDGISMVLSRVSTQIPSKKGGEQEKPILDGGNPNKDGTSANDPKGSHSKKNNKN